VIATQGSERDDWFTRFSLLASAITGVRIPVMASDGRTYTDARTIFLARDTTDGDVRDAVAMQAALLAGGALSADVLVRLLRHRRSVAQRYLCLEAIRLSAALSDRLPPATVLRMQQVGPARSTTSDESYRIAVGAAPVPPSPQWLGTLKLIRLLRGGATDPGRSPSEADPDSHQINRIDPEPEDDEGAGRSAEHPLSGPLSTPLGGLLRKLLQPGRSTDSDGDSGAEIPVSRRRVEPTGTRANRTVLARAIAGIFAHTAPRGVRYPEWDDNRQTYREQWCAVAEYDPPPQAATSPPSRQAAVLRRPLARVSVGRRRHSRQLDGDDVDINAAIDYATRRRLGELPDPAVYERSLMTKRDLSVLVLLDATGSTNEQSDNRPIFEEERRLADDLIASLDGLGDQVAAYGFYSHGRESVQFLRIKQFDQRYDNAAQRRLQSIEPSGFTRLGAAVRHATHLLQSHAQATNMVLVLIGDGLPYDGGYENRYARADTRRAVAEAVLSGVGVVGLAIRSSVEPVVHEEIWSQVPFRVVGTIDDARKHLRSMLIDALNMTRSNGRRRELLTAGEREAQHSWVTRGRRFNSYT
jgi:nitric oxide reductase NorD protein